MSQTSAAPKPGWEGTFTDFDGSKHYVWVPVVHTHDGTTVADYARAVLPPCWSIAALQEARSRLERLAAPSANTTMLDRVSSERSRHSA